MAGIFDIKRGAFDSSEAISLHQAYEIALQGLKSTQTVDRAFGHRLARSIVKVARSEPDCLRNDGTIDPIRLAQRAILRMLQTSAPNLGLENQEPASPVRGRASRKPADPPQSQAATALKPESPAKVMMRIFERTPFAKL